MGEAEALLELAGLVMLLGAVNRDRVGFVHAAPGGNDVREPVRGRGRILQLAASLMARPAPAPDAKAGKKAKPDKPEKAGAAAMPGGDDMGGMGF